MKLNTVYCMVLTTVGVYTLSIPTSDHGSPSSPVQTEKMEERLAMLPAIFKMSEEIVTLGDRNQCMEKMVCLLENNLSESANNSFYYLSKYLTNKNHDLDDASFSRVLMLLRNYPRMERLVEAITLAQSHRDPEICSITFPECSLSAEGLISAAKMFDDGSLQRSGQTESGSQLLGQTSGIRHRTRRELGPDFTIEWSQKRLSTCKSGMLCIGSDVRDLCCIHGRYLWLCLCTSERSSMRI